MGSLNSRGHEVNDPQPMALPPGVAKPETLAETIRRLVRNEISARASDLGHETFEEADDFDVEDDHADPQSQWELNYDQESEPRGSREANEGHGTDRNSAKRAGPDERADRSTGTGNPETKAENHRADDAKQPAK